MEEEGGKHNAEQSYQMVVEKNGEKMSAVKPTHPKQKIFPWFSNNHAYNELTCRSLSRLDWDWAVATLQAPSVSGHFHWNREERKVADRATLPSRSHVS